jgi:hypothetical protein
MIDKIYLDNYCFNRPYDDQINLLNRMETEAKFFIQELILGEKVELAWSFVLDYENSDNPFEERRIRIADWREVAVAGCDLCDEMVNHAERLMRFGLR